MVLHVDILATIYQCLIWHLKHIGNNAFFHLRWVYLFGITIIDIFDYVKKSDLSDYVDDLKGKKVNGVRADVHAINQVNCVCNDKKVIIIKSIKNMYLEFHSTA